jgi:photosystem II stability/assembly factor-like uncharacterized protein
MIMIKKPAIILVFLLMSGLAFPQWALQNSNVTNPLTSVWFTSAQQGWAAGGFEQSGGIILATTDGGLHWKNQYIDSTTSFSALCFTSSRQGWVAGGNGYGVILATVDSGHTWTPQTCRAPNLYAISFVNDSLGWAVGYNRAIGSMVLKTTNGGSVWNIQFAEDTSGNAIYRGGMQAVYFISALQGWAGGSGGGITNTVDGGLTWNAQTSGTTNDVTSLFFISPTRGWAAAGGSILSTTDGGLTWITQFEDSSNGFSSVYFSTPALGWAAGGTIIATTDSGATWQQQANCTADSLSSVFFTSGSQGWALGLNGIILHTGNGGINASVQSVQSPGSLQSTVFPNPMQENAAIRFSITSTSAVKLELYDLSGKKLETLLEETKAAGEYIVPVNKQGYSNGMYFYRLQVGDAAETGKMVIQ